MKTKATKIFIITLFLFGLILIIKNSNNKTFAQDGITYAVSLDGKKTTSFPSKGLYKVNVECANAKCNWDYANWQLNIYEITGDVSANLAFTTIEKKNLNSYIIGLSGKTQGTGQVVNEKGYRYEGRNPNNYIWFNDELWQIIGVFDSSSHGQNGENLVKIIRKSPILGVAFDKSWSHTWSQSSLKKLFNPIDGDANSGAYYWRKDGTESGYCYGAFYSTTAVKRECDYTDKGIKDSYRPMIKNVNWYLGSSSSNEVRIDDAYTNERSGVTDTGYIGLMYLSDYGYAAPSSNCPRSTQMVSYMSCAGENWMFGKDLESTISPCNYNNYKLFVVADRGDGSTDDAEYGYYAKRPVLYLDSSVYLIKGDGSEADPYIIGM